MLFRHQTAIFGLFLLRASLIIAWEHVSGEELRQTVEAGDSVLVAFVKPEEEASAALENEWLSAADLLASRAEASQIQAELLSRSAQIVQPISDSVVLSEFQKTTSFVAYLGEDAQSASVFEDIAWSYPEYGFKFGAVIDDKISQEGGFRIEERPVVVGYKDGTKAVFTGKGKQLGPEELRKWIELYLQRETVKKREERESTKVATLGKPRASLPVERDEKVEL
ncbi:uncharacterized protein CTHT_0024610 [Thermochaetoides thermophila DSM 1495]|uniref:Thioredoxin domain-containing protein n=1 Tax=Chaetomium thermophilum (strain DSM 1495 / CBS 144.50 / IMI 039719) TaxID=759272 RepID=G0S5F4_CHATD|nr:hypothetical protein CTHT_0024610 [Thermochaetoides thermophila DSM 1495]EGS20627.1 hypothetical protein CTHT_0024610 [Thermochaetoides thermophila DSM 1495]